MLFLAAIFFAACSKEVIVTEPPKPAPIVPAQDDTTNLKNYTKDITIVNWNIEWFGDGNYFAGNLDVQEANAAKIIKFLNADLYGICEVVDTARFGRMIRNTLGDDFRYKISPYANVSQKLALVYNRNIFRNVTIRPFMGLSAVAYNSFAAGRFPFLLTADVVVNNTRQKATFILLHAKANADIDSYTKRLNGSKEMKDSLDSYHTGKNIMLFGDFNDNFNGSILYGKASPYQNFLSDMAQFNAITLPLNNSGFQSTISYANSVIDQQIISSGMAKWYVNNSASIRTDVINVVPNFKSGNTSDHYPVSSVYQVKP